MRQRVMVAAPADKPTPCSCHHLCKLPPSPSQEPPYPTAEVSPASGCPSLRILHHQSIPSIPPSEYSLLPPDLLCWLGEARLAAWRRQVRVVLPVVVRLHAEEERAACCSVLRRGLLLMARGEQGQAGGRSVTTRAGLPGQALTPRYTWLWCISSRDGQTAACCSTLHGGFLLVATGRVSPHNQANF